MLGECAAAAAHLASFISPAPDADRLAAFTARLTDLLADRYQDHWHPNDPERGSAYRAIVRSGSGAARIDPIVLAAADEPADETAAALARGGGVRWTVWVDPGCVSIRVGDSLDWASVTVIWGALPAPAAVSRPLAVAGTAQAPLSPSKRSRAIQIVDPSARRVSQPALAPPTPAAARGPFIGTVVIPPTPCAVAPDAGPMPSPTRASPPMAHEDPFLRPSSRAESTSSADSIESRATSIFSHSAKSSASSEADVFARPAMPVPKRPVARHQHTSSTASNGSVGSIGSSISRPSSAAGSHTGDKVIDYSGGRVGVLGGNVMLGLPSGGAQRSSSTGSSATIRDDGAEHSGTTTPVDSVRSSIDGDAPRRVRGQRSRSRARSANGQFMQPYGQVRPSSLRASAYSAARRAAPSSARLLAAVGSGGVLTRQPLTTP